MRKLEELDEKEIKRLLDQLKYFIEDLDTGEGADAEELKYILDLDDKTFNYLIKILMENGEIMEIKPGKYRLLK